MNTALLRDLLPGVIYAVVFLLITFWFCRDFRCKNPGIHFTFGIVGIWAAIAGLTPSLLLLARVAKEIDAHTELDLDASLAMLVHQGCIMYMARLTHAVRRMAHCDQRLRSSWRQFSEQSRCRLWRF